MAQRHVVRYGNAVIRKKAKSIRKLPPNFEQLVESMAVTMREHNGIGLAANQVGEALAIAVVDLGEGPTVLVNPQIVEREGEQTAEEGCLSLPRLHGNVTRAQRVKVKARNRHGKPITIEAEGLLARVLQHEVDHLNGVVFLDRVDPSTLHWVLDEVDEEGNYKTEPVTVEEARRAFETQAGKQP
jgi:peptide deformylase